MCTCRFFFLKLGILLFPSSLCRSLFPATVIPFCPIFNLGRIRTLTSDDRLWFWVFIIACVTVFSFRFGTTSQDPIPVLKRLMIEWGSILTFTLLFVR